MTQDSDGVARRSRIAAAVALLLSLASLRRRRRGRRAGRRLRLRRPPTTYETTEDRKLYMQAMDLAGYDMLFPKDPFFSQSIDRDRARATTARRRPTSTSRRRC